MNEQKTLVEYDGLNYYSVDVVRLSIEEARDNPQNKYEWLLARNVFPELSDEQIASIVSIINIYKE